VLSFWSNCKTGVKLQASFALVMLVFVAAIIGIFAANEKVEALASLESKTIVPARSAANRLEMFAMKADDDGAYYLGDRRPAQASQRLAKYRLDVASYQAKLAEASKLSNNDAQRALIADIHAVADGPKGWLQGNEHAFALKAAGKFDAAQRSYFDSPPNSVVSGADKFLLDTIAQSDASYAEVRRLHAFSKTLGILLLLSAIAFGIVITTLIGRTIVERERANVATTQADIVQADNAALQREMAERQYGAEQLAFAASHDELTGLANRTLLITRLDRIVAQTYSGDHLWAILFIDLDRFKVVNDSLGHALGDLVLIETARRLERCLRSGDTLARLGGDEFIILLDGIEDVGVACRVAQRLLRALDTPFALPGHAMSISASIGIATSRNGENQPEDVLRNADIAMYRAKSLGERRYALFSPELLGNATQRLELETDLAHALERREFCLFYQPLVAMHNGCLIGFEALVRWRHPQRGLVNPNDFIPLAEETGAMIPLGEWIFHEACRQLKEWQSTLPGAADLCININVSAKQLASPDFFATVESALATSGLRGKSINLEITESVLLYDADDTRQTLSRIRNLGIQIHLDDFGTGYSSLSYLRDFPIDALKIDRSFVSKAEDEETAGLASADIVRSIIALAESMSLSVTAEGVETAAQVEALRDLGCTNMQGFYFSRPVEAVAAASIISTTTKSLASAPRGATSPFPAEPVATQ
jgi:diguanylate cyclase (GGDEF)-like protein